MINIDTQDIAQTQICIDGKTYEVIPHTIANAEKIAQIEQNYSNRPDHEKYLAMLEVLLGKEAVRELFPNGKNEIYERIIRVADGALQAFNWEQQQREQAEMDRIAAYVEKMRPAVEMMSKMPVAKGR